VFRPIVPDRLADVLREPEPTPAAVPNEPNSAPLDVMVVDDNAVNLLVACRLIEAMGHRTVAAKDGLEALLKLDTTKVDLIFMDCQMPGLDGYETTRRIRARYGRQHRILALTAAAFEQDRRRALDSGMDGLLHKPVDMDRLREALQRVPRAGMGEGWAHDGDTAPPVV
jgi:CheY-like chemotaxis protein